MVHYLRLTHCIILNSTDVKSEMNPSKIGKNLKNCRRRKPFFKLTLRQRNRLLQELRQSNKSCVNVRTANLAAQAAYDRNIDVVLSSPKSCHDLAISIVGELDSDTSSLVTAVNDVNSASITHPQNNFVSTSDCNIKEMIDPAQTFRESLASAFIKGNLTHIQGNIILKTLRSLPQLAYLPRDTRTLLDTPRVGPQIRKVYPGEYFHIGFKKVLTRILQRTVPNLIPNVLEIDFSTDGARLNKSGTMQIWPIQCLIANIPGNSPEIVGIYKGSKKPASVDEFLSEFIADVLQVIGSRGIFFSDKHIPIVLRAFIADAPARSWILNHFGHTSSNPCQKCKVVGVHYNGQMVFTGIKHPLRTNDEYAQLLDDDHHKGPTPLSRLPIGLVSQVPVEYMHLICIGVVKKLLTAFITGKYGKKMKLSGRNQDRISKRLQRIALYCPREFSRKPRPLADYKDYKATEGRQFALYTGPVALQDIMDEQGYKHFLLFHAAVRALCHSKVSPTQITFAKLALEKFVETCPCFYDVTFLSYNVHALLHLSKDVERLGPLDSFSAFPYENNIMFFRKYYRKPHRPLQQFAFREAERQKREELKPSNVDAVKVFGRHSSGPFPVQLSSHCVQYKKLQTKNFFLNVDSLGDRCIVLINSSICIVLNIVQMENIYYLIINKFQIVEDFYNVAISSSRLGVFICSALSDDCTVVDLNKVKGKCYLMPCWKVQNDNDSDVTDREENEPIPDKFIVSTLL